MTGASSAVVGGPKCPAPGTPRIYVACLAAYNAGRLHGRWIDADQEPDEIWNEVHAMLVASPEPLAEEWAIHDYEGFGELQLGESESFDRVGAIAAGIVAHGAAFSAWLSCDSSLDPTDTQAFQDSYRGEWNSMREYAEYFADDVGLYDEANRVESPYIRLDIELLERDLNIELYTVDSDHCTVHVFDPNA